MMQLDLNNPYLLFEYSQIVDYRLGVNFMGFVMEPLLYHYQEGKYYKLLIRCILVMEEGSYAANAIKHCVRPCDMTGKSAAIILR